MPTLTLEQQARVGRLMDMADKAANKFLSKCRCRTLISMGLTDRDDIAAQAGLILCEEVANGNETEDGRLSNRIISRLHDYLDALERGNDVIPKVGVGTGEEGYSFPVENAADDGIKRDGDSQAAIAALDVLTDDERYFLSRYDAGREDGLSVEQIAERLGVSRRTIDRRLKAIETKLRADPNAPRFLASLRGDLRRTPAERETESTATQRRPHKAVFKEIGGVWVVRLEGGSFWLGDDDWSASWEKAKHFAGEGEARAEASRLADDGYTCAAEFIPRQRVRVLTDERQRQQRKPVLDTLKAALDAIPWLFADAVYPQLLTKPGNGGIE